MHRTLIALLLLGCASGPQLPILTSMTEIHIHCTGNAACVVDRSGVDAKPTTVGNHIEDSGNPTTTADITP
jgi:hypothetical protein